MGRGRPGERCGTPGSVPHRDRAACGFRVVHIAVTGMKSLALSCPRALRGGQGHGAAAWLAFSLLRGVSGRPRRYGCAGIGCRSRPSGRSSGGWCLRRETAGTGGTPDNFIYRPCDGLPAGERMPPVFVIRKPAGEAYPCHRRGASGGGASDTNRVRRGHGRAFPPRIDRPAGTRGGRERRTALVATPAASASPLWASPRFAITGMRRFRAAPFLPVTSLAGSRGRGRPSRPSDRPAAEDATGPRLGGRAGP